MDTTLTTRCARAAEKMLEGRISLCPVEPAWTVFRNPTLTTCHLRTSSPLEWLSSSHVSFLYTGTVVFFEYTTKRYGKLTNNRHLKDKAFIWDQAAIWDRRVYLKLLASLLPTSTSQSGPVAVLLRRTLNLSFIFSTISHSLGVDRETTSGCFSRVFLCIF